MCLTQIELLTQSIVVVVAVVLVGERERVERLRACVSMRDVAEEEWVVSGIEHRERPYSTRKPCELPKNRQSNFEM